MRLAGTTLLISIFLISCFGTSDQNEKANFKAMDPAALADSIDFSWPMKDFSDRFTSMINTFGSQDMHELDKYISPEFGLLIIESESGAMPHFHIQKQDDAEYRQHIEHICNTISFDGKLLDEPLPRIDCESKYFYTKTGSFVQDTNVLAASDIWKYGNLLPDDEQFAEYVINSVSRTVIITSGYTYYFSFYQKKWYLTIIDIRRPCQA